MDKTSIIGLILGIIAVGVGMFLKGVSPAAIINPAALLIIFVGTVASVLIAFPTADIKTVPKLMKIIFQDKKQTDPQKLIKTFSNWAQLARQEGLLSLEEKVENINDSFLKNGMMMAIDGQSAEYIHDVLSEEIDAMEERHQVGASIFTQAGTYAPTLGVLGAVVGLIAALGNLQDTDVLGAAIAAAFVATLLGIFSGYVLWHPFANKLRRKSKQEAQIKMMMIEGVISILEGEAPRMIEQKLVAYLPSEERSKYLIESSVSNN